MVSIRRRKLLALCSGRSSFLAPVPISRPFIVHPIHSVDLDKSKEKDILAIQPGLSNTSTSSSSKEQHEQLADPRFRAQGTTGEVPIRKVPEVKRRKRHKRKHIENQEPCVMRGVYHKNMKWQAAIKVDKKQIHLGTCGSQEEAARLYDRAAFMCGREPNFELSKEDKHELRKLKWDEFLALTRSAITNKRYQRRSGVGLRRKFEAAQSSDWEEGDQGGGFSGSED